MTEAELQACVIDLARWHQYLVMHITDSRKSNAVGFPDLVLLHQQTGALLMVELKSETGKLRAGQAAWINALEAGGHDVYVWRPAHWESGAIQSALARGARAAA